MIDVGLLLLPAKECKICFVIVEKFIALFSSLPNMSDEERTNRKKQFQYNCNQPSKNGIFLVWKHENIRCSQIYSL